MRPWALRLDLPAGGSLAELRQDILTCRGQTLPSCPVIEQTDWVRIALTADLNIVLVDQYRHAVGRGAHRIPGGYGRRWRTAARGNPARTTGGDGLYQRRMAPARYAPVYPAVQNNRIHSFLALNARPTTVQSLDGGEVIHSYEMPYAEFIARVQSGALGFAGAPACRPVVAGGGLAQRAWRPRDLEVLIRHGQYPKLIQANGRKPVRLGTVKTCVPPTVAA